MDFGSAEMLQVKPWAGPEDSSSESVSDFDLDYQMILDEQQLSHRSRFSSSSPPTQGVIRLISCCDGRSFDGAKRKRGVFNHKTESLSPDVYFDTLSNVMNLFVCASSLGSGAKH